MATGRRNRLWNQLSILLQKNNIYLNDNNIEDTMLQLQNKHIYEGKEIEDIVSEYVLEYNKNNKQLFNDNIFLENEKLNIIDNKEIKEEMSAEIQDALDKKVFGEKMKLAREQKKAAKQQKV